MPDTIIEDVVSEVLEKAPEPTPTADKIIEDEISNTTTTADSVSSNVDSGDGITDAVGCRFNPLIHETGSDGKGVLGKNGQWRKKRGRKSGQHVNTASNTTEGNTSVLEPTEQAKQLGAVSAHLTFTTCTVLLGDEWQPIIDAEKGINEPKTLAEAYAVCYDYYGIEAPAPWAVLAIALAGYILPRLQLPKTQGRLTRLYLWLRTKLGY